MAFAKTVLHAGRSKVGYLCNLCADNGPLQTPSPDLLSRSSARSCRSCLKQHAPSTRCKGRHAIQGYFLTSSCLCVQTMTSNGLSSMSCCPACEACLASAALASLPRSARLSKEVRQVCWPRTSRSSFARKSRIRAKQLRQPGQRSVGRNGAGTMLPSIRVLLLATFVSGDLHPATFCATSTSRP